VEELEGELAGGGLLLLLLLLCTRGCCCRQCGISILHMHDWARLGAEWLRHLTAWDFLLFFSCILTHQKSMNLVLNLIT
jgi:hypothetical protein